MMRPFPEHRIIPGAPGRRRSKAYAWPEGGKVMVGVLPAAGQVAIATAVHSPAQARRLAQALLELAEQVEAWASTRHVEDTEAAA